MDSQTYETLCKEFSQSPADLGKVSQLLQAVILQLSRAGLLSAPKESLSAPQLAMIRDVLEMGAYWSVYARDGAAFERYLAQLAPYYADSESPRMGTLLGLRLLNLLVVNKRAEFHTSLARLGPARQSPQVQFVVQLEQCLMEGTFHRLLLAREQVPAPEYVWFVDSLLETVRMELATGLERSFGELQVSNAASLLLLGDSQLPQLVEFAGKRGWIVQGDRILFPPRPTPIDNETVPTIMMNRALQYAAALEQIV